MNPKLLPTTDQNSWGTQVTLDGSNPNDTRKLIQLDDMSQYGLSWLAAISSTVDVTGINQRTLGPIIKGQFGTGSLMHSFECDAKPDTVISLPGTSCDIAATWDRGIVFNAVGGGSLDTFSLTSSPSLARLPISAKVGASVKHGNPAIPNATRTKYFYCNAAAFLHDMPFELPPFSSELMVYFQNDAQYAAEMSLLIFTNGTIGGIIDSYTAATVLAIKNAGGFIPIPGNATQVIIETPNPGPQESGYIQFNLNL